MHNNNLSLPFYFDSSKYNYLFEMSLSAFKRNTFCLNFTICKLANRRVNACMQRQKVRSLDSMTTRRQKKTSKEATTHRDIEELALDHWFERNHKQESTRNYVEFAVLCNPQVSFFILIQEKFPTTATCDRFLFHGIQRVHGHLLWLWLCSLWLWDTCMLYGTLRQVLYLAYMHNRSPTHRNTHTE